MFAQIFNAMEAEKRSVGFAAVLKKDFVGENVPRDENGRWTKLRFEHGKGWQGDKKPLTAAQQEQLKKVGPVPPAWTDVHLNPDPNADTQVKGRDAKGKQQIKQHPEAVARNAAAKWERVGEFHREGVSKIINMATQVMDDKKRGQQEKDVAALVYLVSLTGFRIGSEADTGAAEQAYGASTLEKRHIKVNGEKITFSFVGKKGVPQSKTINDAKMAAYLNSKLETLKPAEQVFTASDANARAFIKAAAGNDKFKAKDFRTWHGTGLALALRKAMKPPKTTKEYKQKQNEIAQAVADHLGNTKTVALNSYIAPMVWAKWDPSLAPQKKGKAVKFDDGFSFLFDEPQRVTKDEMPSFQELWQAIEDALNDPAEGDPPEEDAPVPVEKAASFFMSVLKDSAASIKAWNTRGRKDKPASGTVAPDKGKEPKVMALQMYMEGFYSKLKNEKERKYVEARVKQLTSGEARPKGMSGTFGVPKERAMILEFVTKKIFLTGREKLHV